MMGHRSHLFGHTGDSDDSLNVVRGYGGVDLEWQAFFP
jgi:hypothetical protein